jgi:hypothetical protein
MSGLLHYVVTYVWEGDIIYTGESKEYGAVTVRASMPKYCETYTFSIGTFACTPKDARGLVATTESEAFARRS